MAAVPVVLANFLQPLIDVCDAVLVFFHDHLLGSWGFSIIALTVVVRLILLPLTLKQFRSMQALQKLSPQIKALQAKYKDDRQRLNQEMMKFYQENKVNPFASCLPLAAQMPVFLALFYMLRKDLKYDICPQITQVAQQMGKSVSNLSCQQVDPGSAKFLFIPDLTAKATGAVLVVLIILYVSSQLVSSLVMSVSADKNQRRLIVLLPLIFVTFVAQFPTGLIVYWITTNLWTILQGYIVRHRVGPLRPPTAAPQPAVAKAAAGGGQAERASPAPPPPPRKRSRKRSGRRR
jgi:YidC/Oxa1 family membrane protein insertase